MTTNFERFKIRNQKHGEAQAALNTHFIFKGYPSIKITSGNEAIQAAVVNKQEKDLAYIYTYLENPLILGSVWEAKDLHFLIAEHIVTIKDVNWNKYLCYLCNIEVENTWGFFKGPEKTYINIKNEQNTSLESLQKPILVLPSNVLGFSDKIVIKQRPWLVQEYDAISSPNLVYYSLRATTISKEEFEQHQGEDVFIVHATEHITPIPLTPEEIATNIYSIGPNVNVTLSTEEGYFKTSNALIKILKHNANEIIFSIPFGIETVTIETKEGGNIVSRTYKVV